MTLVAQTTSPAADSPTTRTKGLQEWALTRESIDDHLHAIELVLTHDFDEPSTPSATSPRREAAQRAREQFVIDATGVANREHARQPVTFIGPAATENRHHRIAA